MSRRRRLVNVTVQVDEADLTWARTRALFAGTSVNRLIRTFLEEYAAVPQSFRDGLPPPWGPTGRAIDTFAEVMDPRGAGDRAREGGRRS
jgi:hypothetical protein